MKVKIIGILSLITISAYIFLSFKSDKPIQKYTKVQQSIKASDLIKNYQSWYKVTQDTPNTGDPTGFLDHKHGGTKAYRVIYINKIGEAVNRGHAPYKYPTGTVVVKEEYKNEAAWKKGKMRGLKVMVKLKKGESPETGDWGYAMSKKENISMGTSKRAKFCGGCHVFAASKDYLFMNTDFMNSLK